MFTTLDKALVAVVMGIVSLLNLTGIFSFNLDPGTVQSIIAVITPILIYFIPNKKPTG
jgi:hypothetical protein